jgi:uncharacterized protein YodC (DUF2158 family)
MKVGDVVALGAKNSPEMVVESIRKGIQGKQSVSCTWITGAKKAHAVFDPKVLKSVAASTNVTQ